MQPLIIDRRAFSPSTTFVQNLTQSSNFAPSILINQWVYCGFNTGSQRYLLESITLPFRLFSFSPNLFVSLYTDNGGLGSKIIDFIHPSTIPSGAYTNIMFLAPNPVVLESNATYNLVSGISSGSGEYRWIASTSFSETGLTGWTINNQSLFSNNQGFSWSNLLPAMSFKFSVDGEII